MSDKTYLAVPGSKMLVPRLVKRTIQVAAAVALTMAVALGLMMASGLLQAKSSTWQVWAMWLTFVNRPDIQATMVLTAIVTVTFVYWQRDQERGGR